MVVQSIGARFDKIEKLLRCARLKDGGSMVVISRELGRAYVQLPRCSCVALQTAVSGDIARKGLCSNP